MGFLAEALRRELDDDAAAPATRAICDLETIGIKVTMVVSSN
jgi:hypothetical protein